MKTNLKSVIKLGSLIAREHKAQVALRKLTEQVRAFAGASWLCSEHGVCADGVASLRMRIALVEYLKLFPEHETPKFQTWESCDRGTLQYMAYPNQYLGKHGDTHIWVYAESENVVIKAPEPKPILDRATAGEADVKQLEAQASAA